VRAMSRCRLGVEGATGPISVVVSISARSLAVAAGRALERAGRRRVGIIVAVGCMLMRLSCGQHALPLGGLGSGRRAIALHADQRASVHNAHLGCLPPSALCTATAAARPWTCSSSHQRMLPQASLMLHAFLKHRLSHAACCRAVRPCFSSGLQIRTDVPCGQFASQAWCCGHSPCTMQACVQPRKLGEAFSSCRVHRRQWSHASVHSHQRAASQAMSTACKCSKEHADAPAQGDWRAFRYSRLACKAASATRHHHACTGCRARLLAQHRAEQAQGQQEIGGAEQGQASVKSYTGTIGRESLSNLRKWPLQPCMRLARFAFCTHPASCRAAQPAGPSAGSRGGLGA
jgi:hypothetical protein